MLSHSGQLKNEICSFLVTLSLNWTSNKPQLWLECGSINIQWPQSDHHANTTCHSSKPALSTACQAMPASPTITKFGEVKFGHRRHTQMYPSVWCSGFPLTSSLPQWYSIPSSSNHICVSFVLLTSLYHAGTHKSHSYSVFPLPDKSSPCLLLPSWVWSVSRRTTQSDPFLLTAMTNTLASVTHLPICKLPQFFSE